MRAIGLSAMLEAIDKQELLLKAVINSKDSGACNRSVIMTAFKGHIVYGDMAIVPGLFDQGPGNFIVAGDAHIDGLSERCKLNERIKFLEDALIEVKALLNMIWYAPGNPGYEGAKRSFDSAAAVKVDAEKADDAGSDAVKY
jgi:hypothetical protein